MAKTSVELSKSISETWCLSLTTRGGPAKLWAGVPNPVGITNKKSSLMELFLLVIRSEVIIVSRVSERNNDYVASDRSEVSEHVNASFTQQEHQYKQQAKKCLLFLCFPSLFLSSIDFIYPICTFSLSFPYKWVHQQIWGKSKKL